MKSPIETVSIIGAGGMGCVYASILYDMDPGCVSFVAGGKRLERLRQHTAVVNGKAYPIPVLGPSDDAPPADLVIVAVKHHHLDAAIRDMVRRVGDNTTILSVMNGIESEERLAAHEVPPDMIRTLWWKFMINVGINQVSAALSAPYSVFQAPGEARSLMESAMREVVDLAGRVGVRLPEKDIEDWYGILATLSPGGKTSMLQDVEGGRKTEVEMFAGKVIEMGERYAVPTPVNRYLFEAIRTIEAAGA